MVANLRASQITYDPRLGRYRSQFGGIVSRADVLSIVAAERVRLEGQLTRLTERLTSGQIDISQWQRQVSRRLKRTAIQLAMLGAGGRRRTTQVQYQLTRQELQRQFGFLGRFALQMANGELSEAQILSRVKLYSNSIAIAFNQSEREARKNEGKNEAKRILDPSAEHCPQCPNYQTAGFVPIDSVVPVGVACDCGGNCRCTIAYRFNPNLIDLLSTTRPD